MNPLDASCKVPRTAPSGKAGAAPGSLDPLVRINMPPLMGRRDAALDCAEEMAVFEIPRSDVSAWEEFYDHLLFLVRSAAEDTASICAMLSSPDTRSREERMRTHISMLENVASSLQNLSRLYSVMFRKNAPQAAAPENFAGYEEKIGSAEKNLQEWFRDGLRSSCRQRSRYRAYAAKSFTPENAGRYRRAYNAAMVSFRKNHVISTPKTDESLS